MKDHLSTKGNYKKIFNESYLRKLVTVKTFSHSPVAVFEFDIYIYISVTGSTPLLVKY